ncbi:GDSL esterase/lipase-like [Dorcoceras hygrometricum]|uniref:GDSL esterase/lipase-like n=1 Tax=Dorcoceras hygrometricum TaxID=472368 RepID=A0A2Z7B2X9_9LAMI|nr:GDSL esterase/lipase-like [Dorcoceras hygrometricum]
MVTEKGFHFQTHVIVLVFFLISSSLAPCSSSVAAIPFKQIYAFGDSYTDTGNTRTSTGPTAFNYVSNPPYGITYFHHSTNRYSDGRIVLDFVAEALSLPLSPPYRIPTADRAHGVNFAVAGATAIRHGFFLKNNITFNLVRESLQTQLVWFDKILESKGCRDLKTTPAQCKAIFGDALIWIGEIGANDYTCSLGSTISSDTIRTMALNSLSGFLQVLINKGAKYIVVQGLPPAGCLTYTFSLSSPEDRDEIGCVSTANLRAATHNKLLQIRLDGLRKQNPQAVILYADFYNSHLELVRNPRKYGFKQQFRACCGYGGGQYNFDVFNTCGAPSTGSCSDPPAYLNWDGAHLTEAANRVLADSFLNGTFCSPPFKYLLRRKLEEH